MNVNIIIPDIGESSLPVIEVLVKVGDVVEADAPLLVIESDKASMEVPAPQAGVIQSLSVKVGDSVSTGQMIGELQSEGVSEGTNSRVNEDQTSEATASAVESATSTEVDIIVPDVGEGAFPIIECFVSVGDQVQVDDPILMLESDKASMEIPAPSAGQIMALNVAVGDELSSGKIIGKMRVVASSTVTKSDAPKATASQTISPIKDSPAAPAAPATIPTPASTVTASTGTVDEAGFRNALASPSARKLARELGADLGSITGTGRKARILHDDIKAYVKGVLTGRLAGGQASSVTGSGIPAIPSVDFSKFGEIESVELNRIKQLTGTNLSRSWLNVPHVTQFDQADITELEMFRKSLAGEAEKAGVRVTMLAFLMKALVAAMQSYPRFNASLSADQKSLILKKYFHIGIAVDTPNGLVVPVIRDVEQKGIFALSADLMALSKKARDGKLNPADMQGGCITISSLGGIGGTAFTPIVNAPEVAILGVSRSSMQPVWDGKAFVPRNLLPLSLSYDHRVIDGAEGARFTQHLAATLGDARRLIL